MQASYLPSNVQVAVRMLEWLIWLITAVLRLCQVNMTISVAKDDKLTILAISMPPPLPRTDSSSSLRNLRPSRPLLPKIDPSAACLFLPLLLNQQLTRRSSAAYFPRRTHPCEHWAQFYIVSCERIFWHKVS